MENEDKPNFYIKPLVLYFIFFVIEAHLATYGSYPCADCGGDMSDVGAFVMICIPFYFIINVAYFIKLEVYARSGGIKEIDLKYWLYLMLFVFGVPIIAFGIIMVFH